MWTWGVAFVFLFCIHRIFVAPPLLLLLAPPFKNGGASQPTFIHMHFYACDNLTV
jgi:hypothetical protein